MAEYTLEELFKDDEGFSLDEVLGRGPAGPSPADVRKTEPVERVPVPARRGTMRGAAPYGAGDALPADYREQARQAALPLLERAAPAGIEPARNDPMPAPDVRGLFTGSPEARATEAERIAASRAPETPEQAKARQARERRMQAARAEAADFLKGIEATRGGVYDDTLLGNAAGTAQLGLTKGSFQVVKLAADALRMLPTGDTVGDALTSVSEWAKLSAEAVQKAKSRESRAQAAELAGLLQDPNASIATVAGFLLANPGFVAELGVESAPIVALTGGTGKVGGAIVERLASRAIGGAATTPEVANAIAAIRATASGQTAGVANVAMGAGSVYADALDKGATKADAYTAAGIAGLGYALIGKAARGGAEGAVARGGSGGALRTAASEFGQEFGESLSESAGMASLPGVDGDAQGAVKQALVEGAAGGIVGAGTGALTRGAAPPTVDELLNRTPGQRFDDAMAADVAERDMGPPRTPVQPAPRIEDQPTRVYTPEQVAAMRAAAPAQPAAPGPVAPGAVTPAAAPQAPAPAPAATGLPVIQQGSLAAAAQAALQPAGAPNAPAAPTPAPAPESPAAAPIPGLGAPFASFDEATAYAVENRMQGRVTPAALPDGSGWALMPSKSETGADVAMAQAAAAKLSTALSEDQGKPVTLTTVPERELPGPLAAFARVARAAFSIPVVVVRGAGARGVYYEGTTFIDADVAKGPDLFIHTVGHEARHLLDNSQDPADAQIVAKLNAVIDAYLRPGVVEARQVFESQGSARPASLAAALNETRADVNGAMWLDPEFWGQVYDLDAGSTFRRVLYQFMRAATKFINVAKGSRQDVSTFVTNVEAVREASAQAWAQRAKNKAARNKAPAAAPAGPPKPPMTAAGDLSAYAAREGERIGGVSHLRGIVESLVKTYVNDGPEAGRAKLEDMAANVRGDTGFADEVATPGFIDELDQQLRASAAGFGQQGSLFSRDQDNPYGTAPNGLMGYRKDGPQAGFGEQRYKHVEFVRVSWDNGLTIVDAMAGLNKAHALERARRNWTDAASIEAITRAEAEAEDPGIGAAVDALIPPKKEPVYTHEVIDSRTGEVMGKYQSKQRARAAMDRLDQQFGGYRYRVREIGGRTLAYSRDNDKPDDGKGDKEPEDEGLGNFNLDRNYDDGDAPVEPDEPDIPDDAYSDKGKGKGKEDDKGLSDEEMAAAQAELDALQGRREVMPEHVRAEIADEFTDDGVTFKTREEAKAASDPVTSDYDAVSDDAVKAAGFMAERAFPPLIWRQRNGRKDIYNALVKVVGKVREVQTFEDMANVAEDGEPDDWRSLGWRGSLSGPANREATSGNDARGVGIRSITLSEPGARAIAQRFIASPSLFARGFDLFKSVPVAARERIADTWQAIANMPKAFEFGRLGDMNGRENWRLGQRIGQLLMRGTPFKVDVSPSTNYANRVEVRLSRNGQPSGTAEIEITRQKPPRLIVHAAQLEKGSNYGKPLYQIAYAMADALDAIVEADPEGLTAINTYRRTEHMLSAVLRMGRTGFVQPGVGQRLYGWNPQARGAAEDRKNVVRLALAAARNAVEVFPQIETLRYDLASDRFVTASGDDAEPIVQAAMQTQDVQALSLSRSTMARAAITLQAMREGYDLTGVRELQRPVLYSRALPDEHPHSPGYVSPVEGDTSTAVYSELEGRPIRYEVRIEDTGQVATVTVDGAQAMRELDRREQVTRQLLSCLTR